MEFLSIFGVVAARRRLVALGVLLSLLVGLTIAGQLPFGPSSQPGRASGTAQMRVIVDHRRTIVANTAANAGTIGTQAALLAELMAGDAQRVAIARRAGISPAQLGMQRVQLAQLLALGQLPTRAGRASATAIGDYVVNVWAASPLPVLTIDAFGPSAIDAARVARATRATLIALVAERAPSAARGIAVKPLGDVRAIEQPGTAPSKLLGPAAAIVFFLFWLCAVVLAAGLRRALSNATAQPLPPAAR